jgi:hypothetical protein
MKHLPLLRLFTGFFLLLSVLAAGALARSPWVIAPLAATFAVAFIIGRWRSWRLAMKTHSLKRILSELLATTVIQTVMVAMLYLIGRGVAAVIGRTSAGAFSQWDLGYGVVTAAIGLTLGGIAVWRERNHASGPFASLGQTSLEDSPAPALSQGDEIRLLPDPVTLQSFFSGIHYTHARYEGPENTYVGTPNVDSAGSDEKIAAAEARLGVLLPDGLRALYRTQNGGSVNALCIPNPGVETPRLYDDIVAPFSGYDDLLPCEALRTVFASATDYADPEQPDQSDMFPDGCAKMIILAQWYRHTLFLDYGAGDTPSVGFVDFDDIDWQAHCVRWTSFEHFYSSLRHYETV